MFKIWRQIFLEKLFIEDQGYNVENNILHQDKKSSILLEKNGHNSAGKISWAMDVRYFFITEQAEKGNIDIENCPIDGMVSDFMTKILQGSKLRYFREYILGM